ncbi:MAG: hypothetical protein HKP38_05830 [Croceitalea sp.]|nr:hypothetical protein [Croceitalea sp.]NNC34362.1 hypothetical protein [Croceitalea sp.]NNL08725.1 hypothetical protein [Croceitalea sp.]NNM18322.1 hypothetical protein [Croceitalea sp.]
MAKITSILISVLILIQSVNISMGELVELDELFEHAQFHAEEYGDNFVVFLSKHYGELKAEHEKNHQEERQKHEKLPFNHQLHAVSLSAFVLNDSANETTMVEFTLPNINNYFYLASSGSFEGDGPFQPPRRA